MENDIFHKPIDISDNNIPNGNSIMLLNFSRLGMKNEAKELSNSLNGYLNTYRPLMASSLKAIDYFYKIWLAKISAIRSFSPRPFNIGMHSRSLNFILAISRLT